MSFWRTPSAGSRSTLPLVSSIQSSLFELGRTPPMQCCTGSLEYQIDHFPDSDCCSTCIHWDVLHQLPMCPGPGAGPLSRCTSHVLSTGGAKLLVPAVWLIRRMLCFFMTTSCADLLVEEFSAGCMVFACQQVRQLLLRVSGYRPLGCLNQSPNTGEGSACRGPSGLDKVSTGFHLDA